MTQQIEKAPRSSNLTSQEDDRSERSIPKTSNSTPCHSSMPSAVPSSVRSPSTLVPPDAPLVTKVDHV
eukprot:CAMPEP_0167755900 /NCGR_PEP_ID=MMETSP0110_2-20121227/9076_1 /TAXON_ID=629695 /ORGANISM="Gymnochlora sp., Strain CCMP2014" /LENGTH=67 /DNA_ID=CAMNT_0007641929 /DNA_START=908 /DNA_END=1111 /DNA_ORIENTATION=-